MALVLLLNAINTTTCHPKKLTGHSKKLFLKNKEKGTLINYIPKNKKQNKERNKLTIVRLFKIPLVQLRPFVELTKKEEKGMLITFPETGSKKKEES